MRNNRQDLLWFATFVADSRWRFAKTYVESYPHEYTLLEGSDPSIFARAVRCIERHGVLEAFWRTSRKYLHVGGRKYWHMEDLVANPKAAPTLINRSWLDVTQYREDARALGYDEQQLDALSQRWVQMLQRAQGR